MPEMSVIVLNWNGRQFLGDCLLSLRRQTFRDFETILVDNGSTDGSVAYVSSEFPEAVIAVLPDNPGFVRGEPCRVSAGHGRVNHSVE
jgi:GT2 family glycosyltransferase